MENRNTVRTNESCNCSSTLLILSFPVIKAERGRAQQRAQFSNARSILGGEQRHLPFISKTNEDSHRKEMCNFHETFCYLRFLLVFYSDQAYNHEEITSKLLNEINEMQEHEINC